MSRDDKGDEGTIFLLGVVLVVLAISVVAGFVWGLLVLGLFFMLVGIVKAYGRIEEESKQR